MRGPVLRARRFARLTRAWLPYHLATDGQALSPTHVTLELTYLCNLRCQMCSLVQGDMVTARGQASHPDVGDGCGSRRPEVTTAEYLRILDDLARYGVRGITLTGGEPTLRPDLCELIAACKAHGMHVYLISNGMASPERYWEVIRAGVDGISISIDGKEETHDSIRAHAGSYARASRAIAVVAEARRSYSVSLDVSCAISALNVDEIDQSYEQGRRWSADQLVFGLLHFTTRENQAATEASLGGSVASLKKPQLEARIRTVDPDALFDKIVHIEERARRDGVNVRFTPRLSRQELHDHFAGKKPAEDVTCVQPWLRSRIDPWGQVYPCWLDVRMGDVRTHGFKALWNGGGYRSFRRTIRRCGTLPKCATCPALADRSWEGIPTLERGTLMRLQQGARGVQAAAARVLTMLGG